MRDAPESFSDAGLRRIRPVVSRISIGRSLGNGEEWYSVSAFISAWSDGGSLSRLIRIAWYSKIPCHSRRLNLRLSGHHDYFEYHAIRIRRDKDPPSDQAEMKAETEYHSSPFPRDLPMDIRETTGLIRRKPASEKDSGASRIYPTCFTPKVTTHALRIEERPGSA